MAYTSFEEMRLHNLELYGVNGPKEPFLSSEEGNGNDLKSAALRFIHNHCEKLNFDEKIAENEKNSLHLPEPVSIELKEEETS